MIPALPKAYQDSSGSGESGHPPPACPAGVYRGLGMVAGWYLYPAHPALPILNPQADPDSSQNRSSTEDHNPSNSWVQRMW